MIIRPKLCSKGNVSTFNFIAAQQRENLLGFIGYFSMNPYGVYMSLIIVRVIKLSHYSFLPI